MSSTNTNTANLKPLKIRRSYCCDLCGFLTGSPREFLYHQRDTHGMRINVFECELCIYASKHIQKLQRHYGLVHRQKKTFVDHSKGQSAESKNAVVNNQECPLPSTNSKPVDQAPPAPKPKKEKPGLFKCTSCSYHTRNKVLMSHHEKTVHFKKKVFKCYQCGFVTGDKAGYTKHVKYHNLSKMQCEFCHFKSAYKWNMERHMRNHMTGTNGEYNCTLCNFVTHSKQSLKFHATNHHELDESQDVDDSQEMEQENEVTSDKSGQMVVDELEWLSTGADEFENVDSCAADPEGSDMVWGPEQNPLPTLHCNLCNFATTWPFELKRHEETHKADKKHACPMCGMRFEHIAWLTKHLHRVHREDSEAQNLAAAYELIKPTRRRRTVPNFAQRSLSLPKASPRPIAPKKPGSPKQSLLSSYLKSSTVPKYGYTPPKEGILSKALKQQESQYNFSIPNATVTTAQKKKAMKRVTSSCNKCNYKTKWSSELERHMRVHTDEKPFHCPRCNYHSKWKGDLTRHIAKYHGCKLPISNKAVPLPKLRLKKAGPTRTLPQNNWETVSEDSPDRDENGKEQQDSPLDLTIAKNIFQPLRPRINGYKSDSLNTRGRREVCYQNASNSSYLNMLLTSDKSKSKSYPQASSSEGPRLNLSKKKYFCPFCSFNTSTPSRFHIHIVQHYNRRPFMCSVCGHNSNWEWDITKHIRLKGCKDKEHNNACVLLTDECGRRNYDKYDKYLREVNTRQKTTLKSPVKSPPSSTKLKEEWPDNDDAYTNVSNTPSIPEETPENIIVTPDLPFPQDMAEKMDLTDGNANETEWNENNSEEQNGNFKFFQCKHCNYKHSSKKVVISHLTVHAGVRPFRCRVCGLTAGWRNVIVQHVKTAHNGYMNDVEDRITYIQEGFVIRITSVKSTKYSGISATSGKAMFNCKFCPYNCEKEVYIKFHMKQHKPRDGAIYQCSFCPYFVKFKRTLVRHLKLHETPESQDSNMTFSNPNDIPEMNSQNDANVNYSGQNFDYNYEQNESQQEEYAEEDSIRIAYDQLRSPPPPEPAYVEPPAAKRKRNKEKKHICEHCPYRTDNRTAFLYHKQFHRPNITAPFKCSLCTYWVTMQHLLTQHMKVHRDNDENFEVGLETVEHPVYVESRQSSDSIDIMPVQVEREGLMTKMFKCRFCPMMSKKRANVKVHERMHGETVNGSGFTCSLCNYKCLNQGSLTNHIKMHHGGTQGNNFEIETISPASNVAPVTKKKVFSYFCMRCPAVFKSSSDLFIHKTFHGSTLPFPCPECDYRAKHRIHLHKHLQVHTEAYISKRDASYGPPVTPVGDRKLQTSHSAAKSVNPPQSNKKIDQMLLLELAEVKSFLRNTKIRGRLHKCVFCPACFSKTAILAYHVSLHGSSGQFGCSQCDYATTRSANLAAHAQVHGKITSPAKRMSRVFTCPKCPAVFDKNDRFEKHIDLHGKNHRFACELCDFSTRCAANLTKHRLVHENAEPAIASSSEDSDDAGPSTTRLEMDTHPALMEQPQIIHHKEKIKSPEITEDKKAYACERCPYFQMRKDAVLNHQNRHWQKEGLHCPYCDYRVMGLTFLQNHIKSHVTPTNLYSAQVYMKFEKFEITYTDSEGKKTLFQDKGSEVNFTSRFVPALSERVLNELMENRPPDIVIENTGADTVESDETTLPAEEITEDMTELDASLDDEADVSKESSTDEVLSEEYLPKIILTDILSTNSSEIQADNLLIKKSIQNGIPEFQIQEVNKPVEKPCKTVHKNYSASSNVDSEDTSNAPFKNPKSNIILKIKVEKSVTPDSNETSLYSISNDKPEQDESVREAISEDTVLVEDTQGDTTAMDFKIPLMSKTETCYEDDDDDIVEVPIDSGVMTADDSDSKEMSDDNITDIDNGGTKDSDEGCSVETAEEAFTSRDTCASMDIKTRPLDILKELNSMVNGVCIDS